MCELEVEGMRCGGCVSSVTKAIQTQGPSAKVEVALKAKRVRVDTRAALESLAGVVKNAGYSVTNQRIT